MSKTDDLIVLLREQINKPYVFGAIGPDSFDCSGLIYYVFKNIFSLELPRVSSEQFGVGKIVEFADLQVGDLVFFDTGWSSRKPNHLGVYIGDGKMINANSSENKVLEESILSTYYKNCFYGARRLIDIVSSFNDLPIVDHHFSYIFDLYEKSVVSGYPSSNAEVDFKSENNINRAELLKITLLAFKVAINSTIDLSFPDVPKEAWFYPYVATAFGLGIINGYPDGKFRPEQNVNRAEGLKMILNTAKVDLSSLPDAPYGDVKKEDYFYSHVCFSAEHYLLPPITSDKFEPGRFLTRGEVCRIISRILHFPT